MKTEGLKWLQAAHLCWFSVLFADSDGVFVVYCCKSKYIVKSYLGMQQGIHGYSHSWSLPSRDNLHIMWQSVVLFLSHILPSSIYTNRHIKNLCGATGTIQSKATGKIMHGIEIEIANLRVLTICPGFPRHRFCF